MLEEDSELMLSGYEIGDLIDKGGFSLVKHAIHKESQSEVALKFIKLNAEHADQAKFLKHEIEILSKTDHPNLVKSLEVIQYSSEFPTEPDSSIRNDNQEIVIVMPFYKNGNLGSLISKCVFMSESVTKYYFRELLSGLEYLQDKGYNHGALKPWNILIDDDFSLKISDFGLSSSDPLCKGNIGTKGYKSPEIYN